jgi:uncharacterized protein (DUF433 family)
MYRLPENVLQNSGRINKEPIRRGGVNMIQVEPMPWIYLEPRVHCWRKQLYIKNRQLTARNVAGVLYANQLTEEQTAEDMEIPVEAVREAITYVACNKDLVETEAAYERQLLGRKCTSAGTDP